ncbi:POK9 protein, partial [Eulacestoma nigropectus]|nr:POK9 protein [Eulacestoma nigropectus]
LGLIRNSANVKLADYIEACANISSEQYKAELIATTVAQQLQAAKANVQCFACGDERHVRKQCPKGQKTSKKPNKPCPRCKKGFHWSNQCHSKYDKDGNPL